MYVERDEGGAIIGAYAQPQPYASEFLAIDDPELVAFLNRPAPID
jgi:hypothetical protein